MKTAWKALWAFASATYFLVNGCGTGQTALLQAPAPSSLPASATPMPTPTNTSNPAIQPTDSTGDPKQKNGVTAPPVASDEGAKQNTRITDVHENLFYSGVRSNKTVALTFDDGPDVQTTTEILDILKKYNVKATFFIIGTHALAHPEMVQKIASDGHAIGNHTWDHPNLVKLSPAEVHNEVQRTNDELYAILGYHPAIFRPPYGSTTPQIVQEIADMNYKVVDWSVDTRDWAGTPTPQILNYVHKEIYPGGIILEHCAGGNLKNTVAALPQIITTLQAQGYTFVTVPELLQIPAKIS